MIQKPCPCGSQKSYTDCCQPYIEEQIPAPNAESLMRSRYTAYTLGNMNYLTQTSEGEAKKNFNLATTHAWNKSIKWLGLKVISNEVKQEHAKVEFIARYQNKDSIEGIHEISHFERIKGLWFYLGGVWKPYPKQKLSLNASCWCGSQKKFKNCHAKS